MRDLTRSEAEVVGLLLGRDDRTLRRFPDVAYPHRRTIQEIRHRAYERGWLVDRLIPAPRAFGLDRASFAFARVPEDRIEAEVDRWRLRPECVVLWRHGAELFGVFLHPAQAGPALDGGPLNPASGVDLEVMEVECRSVTLPVYFDYEMAWARMAGLPGVSRACPRPIPDPTPTIDGEPADTVPPFQRNRVQELVRGVGPIGHGSMLGDGFWPARFEERCHRKGWTSFRALLDPVAVGETVGGLPEWVAFVRGTLRPGAEASELFRALVLSARVSPFLLASSAERVMLATMAFPPGHRSTNERSPVLPTFREFLSEISVTNWSLRETEVLVNHDYVGAISPSHLGGDLDRLPRRQPRALPAEPRGSTQASLRNPARPPAVTWE